MSSNQTGGEAVIATATNVDVRRPTIPDQGGR
jgi:hypothetical protein